MKFALLVLSLAAAFASPAMTAEHAAPPLRQIAVTAPPAPAANRATPVAVRAASTDSPAFDWLLGGLGIAIVIGAAGARPRRLTKVSS